MAAIGSNRANLDRAIADLSLTILLLFGDSAATRDVHKTAQGEEKQTPDRRVFLIADLSIPSRDEKAEWSAADDGYAVLGGKPRTVAQSGGIAELCKKDGSASIRKIILAFAAGEQA